MLEKSLFLHAANMTGLNRTLRVALKNRLTVLCYHAVLPREHPEELLAARQALSVDQLRSQLEIIKRHFNAVCARDVLSWLEEKTNLPPCPLLITFDDGYLSHLQLATTELMRAGLPAVFFIPTGHIGQSRPLWTHEVEKIVVSWPDNRFPLPNGTTVLAPAGALAAQRLTLASRVREGCKKLKDSERSRYINQLRDITPVEFAGSAGDDPYQFMNWDEVRSLHQQGFEIGAHTVSHPILSKVSDEKLFHELRDSKQEIERRLQCDCPWVAYPNGGTEDVDQRVFSAARQCGYRLGFKLFQRSANTRATDPMQLDRLCVSDDETELLFHARLSGLQRVWGHTKQKCLKLMHR